MAAKKARKRAYIPPTHEVVNRRERTTSSTVRTTRAAQRPAGQRAAMPYPEPSLKRTLKRLPIYFVMIFALQYFLSAKSATTEERLIAAAVSSALVTVAFAPFMHMMDRFAYNRYLKRTGGQGSTPAK